MFQKLLSPRGLQFAAVALGYNAWHLTVDPESAKFVMQTIRFGKPRSYEVTFAEICDDVNQASPEPIPIADTMNSPPTS
jgi:hypothetical protein